LRSIGTTERQVDGPIGMTNRLDFPDVWFIMCLFDGSFLCIEAGRVPRKSEPTMTNCVRELRQEHAGMTQQALADQVAVTRQTIVAMEAGAYTPSLALALRIARVFGRKVEEIFSLGE